MIFSLFKKDTQREGAQSLYIAAMEQSRLPVFYTSYGVPDSFDARFDLVTLHVYLLMRALKKAGGGKGDPSQTSDRSAECRDMSQKLFEAMFRNLDDTLREMGVGDLSVSKKIRPMAEAFYGRVAAYEAALGASGIRGGDLRSDAPDEIPAQEGESSDHLAQTDQSDPAAPLSDALLRNVYGWDGNEATGEATGESTGNEHRQKAQALAVYVDACEASLKGQPIGRLLTGIVTFPEPPVLAGS